MASPESDSRLKAVLVPSLQNIIKNGSWRKNSKLVHECKSLLEKLTSTTGSATLSSPDSPSSASTAAVGPLNDGGAHEFSVVDSELILSPFLNAAASANPKIADAGVTCLQKLIAHGYLRGEADSAGSSHESKLLARVIDSVCRCVEVNVNDEAIELLVIKSLLTAVTSTSIRIHGDCLLQVVRTCYDVYLGSRNVVNQTTAKASLIQMLVIVF